MFLRGKQEAPPTPPQPDPADTPEGLLTLLFERIAEINKNAGALPVEAVVVGRRILDIVREVIDTSSERELDVRAVVALRGILSDYLPTTVHAYLALDPRIVDQPQPSGSAPSEAVIEQLETLFDSATDLLAALRAHDADALTTQGSFLRTKFSRSDLDL